MRLADLMYEVNQNNSTNQTNLDSRVPLADNTNTDPMHFAEVTEEEIDALAMNTCKSKTHKQTNWGVKLFRGKKIIL